jgi:hypothetical protein
VEKKGVPLSTVVYRKSIVPPAKIMQVEPAQFRSAHLFIDLCRRNHLTTADTLRKQCRKLTASGALKHAVFSMIKAKYQIRKNAFSGINLFVQADDKTLSIKRIKDWFGSKTKILSHGKAAKAESRKVCSGLYKNSSGCWIQDPSVGETEAFPAKVQLSKSITKKLPANYPPDFDCSICNNLMNDPVMTTNDQAYCRSCIEEWFRKDENRRDGTKKGRYFSPVQIYSAC